MAAECDLNPDRRLHYFAELIRLREFAAFANRYRARLPLKVREAFENNVPPRASIRDLVELGNEEAVEQEIHKPPPVRPPHTW